MELRGHEHVVEAAIFAPFASYAALRELGGIAVREPSPRDEFSAADVPFELFRHRVLEMRREE